MDTASFLSHVLPRQGYKFIVLREAPDKPWIHKASEHAAVAADIALQADAKERTVYHACASFQKAVVTSETELDAKGNPKRKYREHSNAAFVKSLWIDLDCGDGKDYPDQRAALADVLRFCKESGIERPLLVSSGNGVHCYWVFDKEIPATAWKRIANIWRCILDHFEVKHDPTCTADVSRVLRPVGTHNRKGEPKLVKVIGGVPPAIDPTDFARRLVALVKQHGISVVQYTPKAKQPAINGDLGGGMEYPPSSAHEIVNHCAQVRDFRDAAGNVEEPLWYAMLGLLKHTVEGDVVCHEWSKGHPDYDEIATQNKIQQWVHGPTSCKKLETLRPEGCQGCPHFNKVTSPIMLGKVLPESQPIEEEVEETGEIEQLPELPRAMREKFSWTGTQLCINVKDEDGVSNPYPFISMYLYPKQYSRDLSDKMDMTWVLRERPGKYKEFELAGSEVAVGGRDLLARLGEQGVVPNSGGKKAMEMYITDWFNALRNSTDEVAAYTTFGWHKAGFLLGDTLFKPDGSEQRVRVQGDAERYAEAFTSSGGLQAWIDDVDTLYNRPGHEQFQWMMGTGFGAPLVKLMGGGMAGCIINGFSSESGLGKSTAGMVGLSMYGNPAKLMLAKNQATTRGLFAYIGVMSSLPILLDEVTNTKGWEFSDLVYTFSNGTGRIGAQSDGSLRANVYGWNTLMASTSNRAIQTTLAASKINATPEIARVFEYKFTRSPHQMSKIEADDLIPRLAENAGHAGRQYLSYVVSHQAEVKDLLAKTRKLITKKAGMSQEERFWLAGMTCITTGLLIAKKLGLVKFDMARLLDWAVGRVRDMRTLVGETETDVIDQFGVMLNELSNGFLVTDKEGDARATESRAMVLHTPKGDLTGRVVTSTQTLYLPVSVLRKWCSENQADYREMTDELAARQWASVEAKPVSLGKGTNDYATAPSRCYRVNLALAGGQLAAASQVATMRQVK